MRVLLRADAGDQRGTGHVMRCLTVAEALIKTGHDVTLMGDIHGVDWLERHLASTTVEHIQCERDELSVEQVAAVRAERVVVDSYWIDPSDIALVNEGTPTMAIVDNDPRGIEAAWYVDQNLGAEELDWSAAHGQVLAGSRYALVRDAIIAHRKERGWEIPGREAHVVAFMGGTDPAGFMTEVARSIATAIPGLHLTAVTTVPQVEGVREILAGMPRATVLGPTPDLPDLLGSADVTVSAAGTSSWDVCAMGRPAVLVGVVENQSAGLAQATRRGVALGVDATVNGAESVGLLLTQVLDDAALRESLVRSALATFDGLGATRVANALVGPTLSERD